MGQSRSPRRRPDTHKRKDSTSSEDEKKSIRHKKTPKPKPPKAERQISILKFSEAADAVKAAIKIQSAYRGFKAREEIRLHHDEKNLMDKQESCKEKSTKDTSIERRQKKRKREAAWAD